MWNYGRIFYQHILLSPSITVLITINYRLDYRQLPSRLPWLTSNTISITIYYHLLPSTNVSLTVYNRQWTSQLLSITIKLPSNYRQTTVNYSQLPLITVNYCLDYRNSHQLPSVTVSITVIYGLERNPRPGLWSIGFVLRVADLHDIFFLWNALLQYYFDSFRTF